MEITVHNLSKSDYLSLKKSLDKVGVEAKVTQPDDEKIAEAHHDFNHVIQVTMSVSQIALSILSIWLHTRKRNNENGRKITLENEKGWKISIENAESEKDKFSFLSDLNDILGNIKEIFSSNG